ncbi:manganese efflux pump MntP family protein [Sporosarcina siberiensis]|uniref:Manganese efflux pump MntP family protein n=1 Tax=Sporosarcina siberiensis TaxID=1365606 RepID=A0ABW4SCP3_9BACL
MQWLTIVLIGIAANIDNLGISVSYGLKSNRIPFITNILIAVISIICAYISIAIGGLLSQYFSQSAARFIGGSILIGLGIWVVATSSNVGRSSSNQKKENSNLSFSQKSISSQDINFKESIILGFVLAINCLTIGFGAGIAGVSPILTALSIGVFSVLFIYIGVLVGTKIGNSFIGNYANGIGGVLLVLIGLYEMMF